MLRDCNRESATITQRVQLTFQLLPSSPEHRWLIAADWIEEHGHESDQVVADAIRDGLWVLNPKNGDGYGNGDGNGDGNGNGNGYGDGDGDGYGNGYGNGDGNGDGNGNGNGYGDGDGNGNGNGYGNGYG